MFVSAQSGPSAEPLEKGHWRQAARRCFDLVSCVISYSGYSAWETSLLPCMSHIDTSHAATAERFGHKFSINWPGNDLSLYDDKSFNHFNNHYDHNTVLFLV